MTKRKRTSLDILDDNFPLTATQPEPTGETAANAAPSAPEPTPWSTKTKRAVSSQKTMAQPSVRETTNEDTSRRKGKSPPSLSYRPPGGTEGQVWNLVHEIASHENRRSVNSILTEGLDMFLRSRGQPSIAELIGEEAYQRSIRGR
jgi:hypothetical protein